VQDSVHVIVLRLLADLPPGRLLDVPAGGGTLADGVAKLGHRMTAVDLFAHPGFRGVLADACAPLPFRDGSFDTVVSIEGIEHFENQSAFLRECARVMRPGGRLVLTTPNILHLGSRLSAFLTGQRLMKQGFVNEVTTLRARDGDRFYHGHAFLIDIFRLRYLLRVSGLELQALHGTPLSSTSVALAPLVPLLWLATRYALWSGRRRHRRRHRPGPSPKIEAEIARLALSPAVLFSRGLVVFAHKPHATGQ
jgi:SAM-dependent methyltransferase